ncbi:MAG: hypothetical protein ACR2NR_09325 [Solirubrobacteraceae bacterium]
MADPHREQRVHTIHHIGAAHGAYIWDNSLPPDWVVGAFLPEAIFTVSS